MTQPVHVAATCCSHKIMCCSHIEDMFVCMQCDFVTTTCVPATRLLPARCHLRVKTHEFDAAACHWDMSLRHDPSCLRSHSLGRDKPLWTETLCPGFAPVSLGLPYNLQFCTLIIVFLLLLHRELTHPSISEHPERGIAPSYKCCQ